MQAAQLFNNDDKLILGIGVKTVNDWIEQQQLK